MFTRYCLVRGFARRYSTAKSKLVLGCGSNVVDQFYMVQAVPKPGEKGYFANANKTHEKSIVGGVTLNHLSWASILGVPAGLLALQGDDTSGKLIRQTMEKLQVSCEHIQVSKDFTTGECFVFVQEDGERSIIMAPGATSLIKEGIVRKYFDNVIENRCTMLTTEISQVPLSGVLALLRAAKNAGVTTVLDLDVSPSVAINEAGLGTLQELIECVKTADVLKPAKHAAQEILSHLAPTADIGNMVDLTRIMREACGSQLLAVTCGAESSILATEKDLVEVPTVKVEKMVDATGAGDAFLGGLVSGLYYNGIPRNQQNLRTLGELGNIVASTCCGVLGALPSSEARNKLHSILSQNHPYISVQRCGDDNKLTKLQGFRDSLTLDAECAAKARNALNESELEKFLDTLENCTGRVLVSGVGKSSIIARRMSSSLASTGTPSHFVHAAEWIHGDLGNARPEDVVVFFSHSGNTEECVQVARYLKEYKETTVLSVVGQNDCALQNYSDVLLSYGQISYNLPETLGVVPSRSILVQEMLINGIVAELIQRRQFTLKDFGKSHPGGSLGKQLTS